MYTSYIALAFISCANYEAVIVLSHIMLRLHAFVISRVDYCSFSKMGLPLGVHGAA